jgi:fumarate reductase subunit D
MLAVFTMPVLVAVFGLLVPFGAFGTPDEVYARVAGLLGNPLAALAVSLGLGLVLWHCCHRTYHALHDLGLHPPEVVRAGIYGVALLAPTVSYALVLAS